MTMTEFTLHTLITYFDGNRSMFLMLVDYCERNNIAFYFNVEDYRISY